MSHYEIVNRYSQDSDFWAVYRKGRPHIPESFFVRIRDYHANHGGLFQIAHDAGAGPGIHSARLGHFFDSIHVTDRSEANIAAARQYLGADEKYTITTATFEGCDHISAASVDLLFVCSAVHYAGQYLPRTIEVMAQQLKPGGTFAIVAAGLSIFHDTELQDLWLRLFQQGMEMFINGFRQSEQEFHAAQKITEITASAYDAVPLGNDLFVAGVERLKINFPPGWKWRSMQVPASMEHIIPVCSLIGEHDDVRFASDADLEFTMSLDEIRAHKDSFMFPPDPKVDDLWSQIEIAVGDKTMSGQWPVVLLLATKK